MNPAVLTHQQTVTDLSPLKTTSMCIIKISLQMCITEMFLTLAKKKYLVFKSKAPTWYSSLP